MGEEQSGAEGPGGATAWPEAPFGRAPAPADVRLIASDELPWPHGRDAAADRPSAVPGAGSAPALGAALLAAHRRRLVAEAHADRAEAIAADAAASASAAIAAATMAAAEAEAAAEAAARAAEEAAAAGAAESALTSGPTLAARPTGAVRPIPDPAPAVGAPPAARDGGGRHAIRSTGSAATGSAATGPAPTGAAPAPTDPAVPDTAPPGPGSAGTVPDADSPTELIPVTDDEAGFGTGHRGPGERPGVPAATHDADDPETAVIAVPDDGPPQAGASVAPDLEPDVGRRSGSRPGALLARTLGRPRRVGAALAAVLTLGVLTQVLGGAGDARPSATAPAADGVAGKGATAPSAPSVDPAGAKAVAFLATLHRAGVPTSTSGLTETQAAAMICTQLASGADVGSLTRAVPAMLPSVTADRSGDVVDAALTSYC